MRSASDQIVDELLASLEDATDDQSVSKENVLEETLPKEHDLEVWLQEQEERYQVELNDAELVGCFSTWRVIDLAQCITNKVMSKTAAVSHQERQKSHQRYLQNRGLHLQRSKVYRVMHMQTLRRKSKAYRRKVKRKIHRPKKRVGSSAGGYSLIPR